MRRLGRKKFLGMSVTTIVILGAAAYLFRAQLQPLIEKVKALFVKPPTV